jgi:acyl-coenzyme A synthetase/AMP-(fatty) acid ligase
MDCTGLDKRPANYAALTPIQFIERAAKVFPNHCAIIHGSLRRSWLQEYERCVRLASAITRLGIRKNEVIAAMLPNTPEMFEMHYGVPMAGAILEPLNFRLDAKTIAFCLQHGEARTRICCLARPRLFCCVSERRELDPAAFRSFCGGQARMLVTDSEFAPVIAEALALLPSDFRAKLIVVDVPPLR